jgi:F-type H+-transporting ATPase subunit epsilon
MQIDVITQTKKLLTAEDITVVTVPTLSGIIQILPGHQNMVSILDVGQMIIKSATAESKTIVLSGGFIDVFRNKITVLADHADLPENLVAEEIAEAIKLAEERMSKSELEPAELVQLEKLLRYEHFKQGLSRV